MARLTFDLAKIDLTSAPVGDTDVVSLQEAEGILQQLAASYPAVATNNQLDAQLQLEALSGRTAASEVDARYRTLVEQIPAVVFMAFLDKGIGEAYVSPQIETMLGFTKEEWLNDPVR